MQMFQEPTDLLIDLYINCVGTQLDLMEAFYFNPINTPMGKSGAKSTYNELRKEVRDAHWGMRLRVRQQYRTMKNINAELRDRTLEPKPVFWCCTYLHLTEV